MASGDFCFVCLILKVLEMTIQNKNNVYLGKGNSVLQKIKQTMLFTDAWSVPTCDFTSTFLQSFVMVTGTA